MEISNSFKFTPVLSKEEFIRKILLKFAKVEDVEPELLKVEFKEVKTVDREFFYVSGKTTCEYTCSIGYNRTENYIEMETKREKVGDTWRDVTRPVNKTRIVTDWQPYSGTEHGDYFTIVNSNGERDKEAELCESFFKKVENCDVPVDKEASTHIIKGAVEELEYGAESHATFSLPGDTYKNFLAKCAVDVEKVITLIIPYYQVTYTFKGKTKNLEFCACADFEIKLEEYEKKKLNYTPLDTASLAKEKVKPQTLIRNISWIAVLIMAIISGFLPIGGFLLIAIAVVIAIIFTLKRSKKYNEIKNELDLKEKKKKENVVNARRKEIYAVLIEVFAKKGYEKISFEQLFN